MVFWIRIRIKIFGWILIQLKRFLIKNLRFDLALACSRGGGLLRTGYFDIILVLVYMLMMVNHISKFYHVGREC